MNLINYDNYLSLFTFILLTIYAIFPINEAFNNPTITLFSTIAFMIKTF